MPAMNPVHVTRTYLVTLMPDPNTAYDPFFVTLTYSPVRAAQLDPRSSLATSQAFRAAIDIERNSNRTPATRRFVCGGSEFVCESVLGAGSTRAPRPGAATHRADDAAVGSTNGQ